MSEEEKRAINNMKLFARVHQDMTVVTAEEMDIVLKLVEKLQRENEKLRNQEETARKVNELLVERYSTSIPVQKVKDKIEEYKNMLKTCNKAQDIDRIKAINERVLELQELLGSEE